jgi:hypothetical protein
MMMGWELALSVLTRQIEERMPCQERYGEQMRDWLLEIAR